MRHLLLAVAAAAALLLLAAVAEANETKEVASADIIRKGLDGLKKLADVFTANIFKEMAVAEVANLLSKSIPLAGSILNLLLGPKESAELAEMRRQFNALHRRLDGIDLRLDELERQAEWNRVRVIYDKLDVQITNSRSRFDRYTGATDDAEKADWQRWFLEFYALDRHAPSKLHDLVMLQYNDPGTNLARAITTFTNSHRRQVMNFLLSITRLVQSGAQMDVAYERLTASKEKADALERKWEAKMAALAHKLKEVEDEVVAGWRPAMAEDVQRFLGRLGGANHQNFANSLHAFLAEKFDWRLWVVVAYDQVTGFDKHTVQHCNGVHYFRVGGRNTAVSSSDPRSSSFNRQRAMNAIEQANRKLWVFVNDGRIWLHYINEEINAGCGFASLRFVARAEASVAVRSSDNRAAVYRMTFMLHTLPVFVTAVVFG